MPYFNRDPKRENILTTTHIRIRLGGIPLAATHTTRFACFFSFLRHVCLLGWPTASTAMVVTRMGDGGLTGSGAGC